MKPEELALKDTGYKQILEILAMTDPNLIQAIQIIENVRKHGYGKVELHISNGKITLVNQTFGYKVA